MITDFTQQESNCIGAQSCIDALAAKESALLLVISDTHGSASTLQSILQNFGSKADALCFCGDGISDVLYNLETASTQSDFAACVPPIIAFARGNGDAASYPLVLRTDTVNSIYVPNDQLLTAAGVKIMLTHGHRYDVYYSSQGLYDAAMVAEASVLFFGHTHIANVQSSNGITLLNPGSCSRPRGGQPHTFALVTVSKTSVDYSYFKIQDTGDVRMRFRPFEPRTGEFPLLW